MVVVLLAYVFPIFYKVFMVYLVSRGFSITLFESIVFVSFRFGLFNSQIRGLCVFVRWLDFVHFAPGIRKRGLV